MAGFSEALLKNHVTLYEGYVTNTNKVLENTEKYHRNNSRTVRIVPCCVLPSGKFFTHGWTVIWSM